MSYDDSGGHEVSFQKRNIARVRSSKFLYKSAPMHKSSQRKGVLHNNNKQKQKPELVAVLLSVKDWLSHLLNLS